MKATVATAARDAAGNVAVACRVGFSVAPPPLGGTAWWDVGTAPPDPCGEVRACTEGWAFSAEPTCFEFAYVAASGVVVPNPAYRYLDPGATLPATMVRGAAPSLGGAFSPDRAAAPRPLRVRAPVRLLLPARLEEGAEPPLRVLDDDLAQLA